MSRVAIAGYATAGFTGETTKSMDELVLPTSMGALEDADVSQSDLDAIMFTGQDTYDGAAISDGQKVAVSGAYEKPSMRIQSGGGAAIHQAAAKIRTGKFDVVSVVAADFVTSPTRVMSWASHEPLYARPIGQNADQSYGFFTTSHLEERDVTVEDLAATAAKNYEAAAKNEIAHRREAYSVDDILSAEPVVGPITELMRGPKLSFGAAVCVLTSEEVAEKRSDDPVWVTGTGLNSSRYRYRDMPERLEQPSLRSAASKAYDEADVAVEDVDVAEIAAHIPSFELLSYEALEFCSEGDAPSLVHDGVTAPDGSLPVNLSGGPLATSPPNSGGLYQSIAAAQALNGELGDVDADTAIVADNDMHLGEPGRSDTVLVLEGGSA